MIPKELQDSILKYLRDQITNDHLQRRAVVRRVAKARAYLKGDPADWFDPEKLTWRSFPEHPEYNSDDGPRYNYHVNIYGAANDILQSAIQTAELPGSDFVPQNSRSLVDQDTAKFAKPVIDYERSVLDYRAIWMQIYEKFYTDGLVLAYLHHVRDKTRYGEIETTKDLEKPFQTPAGYQCAQCQAFTPAGETMRMETGQIACPNCGAELHIENFVPEQTGTQMVKEKITIAGGREQVDLYGVLETILPWRAQNLDKCDYAGIRMEVAPEAILETFPNMTEESFTTGEDPANAVEDRDERSRAKSPLGSYGWFDASGRLPTYGRWWLRPRCAYHEKDPAIRALWLKTFPNGLFLQEVNFIFLNAISERMDDRLVLMKPFESDGMYGRSIGDKGIPIQEAFNMAFNTDLEAQEFAAFPPTLIDSEILSAEGMRSTRAQPGTYKSVKPPLGKSLRDSAFPIVVKESSQAVNRILDRYQDYLNYLMGISQALLGGPMKNTRSAEQYEKATAQSLQRQSTPYEAAKNGMAKIDEALVHLFLTHRTDEEYREIVSISAPSMMDEARKLDPARGRIFARSEQSESIPQTWAQKQRGINALLQSQNPFLQQAITNPNNLGLLFRSQGLPELTVPGKEQQEKMLRLIPILMQGSPQPGQETIDPMSGVSIPGPPEPTIPFDPLFDDPMIVISVLTEWSASIDGLDARQNHPQGFENLRAYAQQAANVIAQRMLSQQQTQEPGKAETVSR